MQIDENLQRAFRGIEESFVLECNSIEPTPQDRQFAQMCVGFLAGMADAWNQGDNPLTEAGITARALDEAYDRLDTMQEPLGRGWA